MAENKTRAKGEAAAPTAKAPKATGTAKQAGAAKAEKPAGKDGKASKKG